MAFARAWSAARKADCMFWSMGRLDKRKRINSCADARTCPERAGYVVADPFQSDEYRAYWQRRGQPAPKACITTGAVRAERERFARMHDLAP